MSDKQALRDFQGRLAERLQAATQASGAEASWLAVEAGTARLLFPLDHAGQIFPWSAMQPVPYVRAWFMGVTNLRGKEINLQALSLDASFLSIGTTSSES